jgi:hypothetical protein
MSRQPSAAVTALDKQASKEDFDTILSTIKNTENNDEKIKMLTTSTHRK